MSNLTVTTKTKAQIAADFAAAFANVKPLPPAKRVTQADRLAPYRSHILKLRRRGFSWSQIATGMTRPPISETVTERLLKRLFGVPRNGRKLRSRAPKTSPNRELTTTAAQASIQPRTGGEPVMLQKPIPQS